MPLVSDAKYKDQDRDPDPLNYQDDKALYEVGAPTHW